jgi:hypothetical protein
LGGNRFFKCFKGFEVAENLQRTPTASKVKEAWVHVYNVPSIFIPHSEHLDEDRKSFKGEIPEIP